MDVLEAIKTRRSIRTYNSEKEVEDEKIIKCVEAARWAPSASNTQPWELLIIKDKENREWLAEIHPYGSFMSNSPVVVLFLGDPAKHEKYYFPDTSVAIQNFLLAAHALGLSTCWMGAFEVDFEEEVKEKLGIPTNLKTVGFVSLGYSDHKPSKGRKELGEMVSLEKYGEPYV
jgi:nitroreductase